MTDKTKAPVESAPMAEAPKAPVRRSVESTFSEKWQPRIGDTIEGKYMGYESAPGRQGDDFKAYQIQLADGKRMSVAGAYLDSLLPQVPMGSHVWLTYTSDRRLPNGTMKEFKLDVEDGVKLLQILKDGRDA